MPEIKIKISKVVYGYYHCSLAVSIYLKNNTVHFVLLYVVSSPKLNKYTALM